MTLRGLFKSANNELEGGARQITANSEEPAVICKKCRNSIKEVNYITNAGVCLKCGFHHRISARERMKFICDYDTFEEFDQELESTDPIAFPGYAEKLSEAAKKSGEKESVITGRGRLYGVESCFFFMEPDFMMGSMGAVTGEKITRVFEYATEKSLPVIGFTVSGGARMQEGMYSLMQMAKVSAAVKKHSDCGNLYIAVLTNPTTGGVTASFAMLADIMIGEPDALIAFAGPRVIEQTIKQKLPEGFQTAEYVLKCGFLDAVAPRQTHKILLHKLLNLHGYCEVTDAGV